MATSSAQQLENIRERISPRLKDIDYLVLSDLRLFLQRFATGAPLRVLDYGAGNSPYASLFPGADYRRADYLDFGAIDYRVDADSKLSIPDCTFDFVLSTQVAEHLPDPSTYFCEAFRVLKPGGRMVVTTHGVWEDHGVPFDFQRWTASGLARDLEFAGFSVNGMFKLTTEERFYVFLMLRWLSQGGLGRWSVFSKVVRRACRLLASCLRLPIHLLADRLWRDCRVVEPDSLDKHKFYSVVAAEVVKPTGKPTG